MIRLTRRLQLLAEEGDPAFSFEFFVPETEEGEDDLHMRIERLAAVAPPTAIEFVAGGVGVAIGRTPLQEARRAVLACSRTKKTSHLSAMLRLSSSWPLTTSDWEALTDEVRGLDITNLVVEKGHVVPGVEHGAAALAQPAFSDPAELVSFLRSRHGDFFCIGAVGYPHVPPHLKLGNESVGAAHARLMSSVVHQLRAGADFVLAQHVLEEADYLSFRDALYSKLLHAGIETGSPGSLYCAAAAQQDSNGSSSGGTVSARLTLCLPPVIPCLLPVHDLQTFFDANAYCGVPIPQEMLQELVQAPQASSRDTLLGSLQRVQQVGNAWITRVCRAFLSWTPVNLPQTLPPGTVVVPYPGCAGPAATPQVTGGVIVPTTPVAGLASGPSGLWSPALLAGGQGAAAAAPSTSCSTCSTGAVGLVLHKDSSGSSSPVAPASGSSSGGSRLVPSGGSTGSLSDREPPALTVQLPPAVPFVHFHTFNLETCVRTMLADLALSSPAAAPRRKLPWRPSCEERRAGEEVRPIHWANRPVSYVERTASWAEFPQGRWTATAQRSFDTLPEERLVPQTAGSAEARRGIWGVPRSEADVWAVFASYVEGRVPRLPWCDMSLHPETATIRQPLIDLNRCGFLTINSQPRVNGARSDDPTFGWGGAGGYVYQKAYVECFCPATHLAALMQALAQPQNASITYHAVDAAGRTYTNCPRARGVHAVTWGVFPAKEIVQPTVVDPEAFLAWKDEAFGLWRQQWAGAYEEDSAAAELIHTIADSYFLVCLVDNDFIGGDVFQPFQDALTVLRETGVALPTAAGVGSNGLAASPALPVSNSVFALSSLSPSPSSVALNTLVSQGSSASGVVSPTSASLAGARRELQAFTAAAQPSSGGSAAAAAKSVIPASLPAGLPRAPPSPAGGDATAPAIGEPPAGTVATFAGIPSSLAGLLSAATTQTPASLRLPAPVGLGTFHPSPGTSSPAFSMTMSASMTSLAGGAGGTGQEASARSRGSGGAGIAVAAAGVGRHVAATSANAAAAPGGRAGPGICLEPAPQTSTTIQGLAVTLPPTFSQPTTASTTTAVGHAGAAAAMKAGALSAVAGTQAPAAAGLKLPGPSGGASGTAGGRSPARPGQGGSSA